MPNPEKPTNKRHYFKLPPGINKMSDAEIADLAAELAKRIKAVMPIAFKQAENGSSTMSYLQRVKADSTLTVRFLEEPTEWIQFFEYFDETAGERGMFLPQVEGVRLPANQKPTMRYLVNALDVEESTVIPLVLTKTTVDQLIRKYEKYSTILDRDYEITRSGTGFDTDYYVEQNDPVKLKLSKYELLDLTALLQMQLTLAAAKDDEDPVSTVKQEEKGEKE